MHILRNVRKIPFKKKMLVIARLLFCLDKGDSSMAGHLFRMIEIVRLANNIYCCGAKQVQADFNLFTTKLNGDVNGEDADELASNKVIRKIT